MPICPNCGARCLCSCQAGKLRLEDIVEVVAFLRNQLGLAGQLSARNFFLSLTVATAHCASYIARHGPECGVLMTTVPNWNSASLRRILRHLVLSKSETDQVLMWAKSLTALELYKNLVSIGQEALFGLLAVYNCRHTSRIHRCDTGASISVYQSVLEKSFQAALMYNFASVADEDTLVASMVRTIYSVDKSISTLGHSKLETDMGTRIVRAVHITPRATPALAKLILAHELVHVALWFHTPHRRTGVHSLEEVFCHAAMSLYADTLLSSASPRDLPTILHRKRACEIDARRRSASCYEQWRQQLAVKHIPAAINSCLEIVAGKVPDYASTVANHTGKVTKHTWGHVPTYTSSHMPGVRSQISGGRPGRIIS